MKYRNIKATIQGLILVVKVKFEVRTTHNTDSLHCMQYEQEHGPLGVSSGFLASSI